MQCQDRSKVTGFKQNEEIVVLEIFLHKVAFYLKSRLFYYIQQEAGCMLAAIQRKQARATEWLGAPVNVMTRCSTRGCEVD